MRILTDSRSSTLTESNWSSDEVTPEERSRKAQKTLPYDNQGRLRMGLEFVGLRDPLEIISLGRQDEELPHMAAIE